MCTVNIASTAISTAFAQRTSAQLHTAADHASSRVGRTCVVDLGSNRQQQKIPRAAGCEAGSQPGRCEKPGRSRPGSGHTSCIDISRCCTRHWWKLDDHLAASPAPVLPVHRRPPLASSLINVQTLRRKRAQIRERVGTQRRLESVVRGRETVANRAALSKLAQRRQRGLRLRCSQVRTERRPRRPWRHQLVQPQRLARHTTQA